MGHYHKILTGAFEHDTYGKSHAGGGWVVLTNGKSRHYTGWKFRISVSKDDVEAAWDIIADILMKRGPDFKMKGVAFPLTERFANPDHSQAGKMIVIYATDAASADGWKEILSEIETALKSAEITPGLEPKTDRAIPGSLYLYYRNDGGPRKLVTAQELEGVERPRWYNPRGAEDPYRNFVLVND